MSELPSWREEEERRIEEENAESYRSLMEHCEQPRAQLESRQVIPRTTEARARHKQRMEQHRSFIEAARRARNFSFLDNGGSPTAYKG